MEKLKLTLNVIDEESSDRVAKALNTQECAPYVVITHNKELSQIIKGIDYDTFEMEYPTDKPSDILADAPFDLEYCYFLGIGAEAESLAKAFNNLIAESY